MSSFRVLPAADPHRALERHHDVRRHVRIGALVDRHARRRMRDIHEPDSVGVRFPRDLGDLLRDVDQLAAGARSDGDLAHRTSCRVTQTEVSLVAPRLAAQWHAESREDRPRLFDLAVALLQAAPVAVMATPVVEDPRPLGIHLRALEDLDAFG